MEIEVVIASCVGCGVLGVLVGFGVAVLCQAAGKSSEMEERKEIYNPDTSGYNPDTSGKEAVNGEEAWRVKEDGELQKGAKAQRHRGTE